MSVSRQSQSHQRCQVVVLLHYLVTVTLQELQAPNSHTTKRQNQQKRCIVHNIDHLLFTLNSRLEYGSINTFDVNKHFTHCLLLFLICFIAFLRTPHYHGNQIHLLISPLLEDDVLAHPPTIAIRRKHLSTIAIRRNHQVRHQPFHNLLLLKQHLMI